MKKLHKNIKIQDGYVSVRIWDRKTRRYYWLDYIINSFGDPVGEWNQYVFFTDCRDDIIRRERQLDEDFEEYADEYAFGLLIKEKLIVEGGLNYTWNPKIFH